MSAALDVASRPAKPLGGKAYGSIPHLPCSRMGPGDWSIHVGQAAILTEKARDRHDRIIVTEKTDGSCCSVARINSEVVALTRAGFPARSSPYEQHHHFAAWVEARRSRFAGMLSDGERCAGEWLLQAHATRYAISHADDLFVMFDVIRGKTRLPHGDAARRIDAVGLRRAYVISDGAPLSVSGALDLLGDHGRHGAIDVIEGAVWRCERKGGFDFMAKFVRPEKADGVLLPEISGRPAVWNFAPERVAA